MTSMTMRVMTPELQLPWESTEQDDARYRKILRNLLIALLAFGIVMPFLPVEELSREKQEALPPHLARVVLEKKVLPPPPPPPKPVEKKVEQKPEKPVEKKPEPKPEPKPKEPPPPPVDKVEEARKVAAVSGVLAFQDALADMRDSVDVDSLGDTGMSRGESQAAKTERSIIAGAAKGGSGGIQTSNLSRDTGGPALSGRETTKVESTIAANAADRGDSTASARLGGRSDESIRRVMDRNKGAIFAVYNRALRKDPTLAGKLVFEMQIDPSGAISSLTLVSSELADESLTQKILARIRMIRFEAEDVVATTVNYSFDFLPY
ncbi:MAG: AgmX/PglI C-terminal domain-containing protein [Halieaceae bacterium]|nr:AgmX/PglI C-terminal domain-containing protein [Halieaceae bacterium]